MNHFPRWAMPALVFLLCGAAGWTVAGSKASVASQDQTRPLPSKSPDRTQDRHGKSGIPEEVKRLLVPVRDAKTKDERMQATVHLAQSIPVSELREWFEKSWFGFEGSLEAEAFGRITRDRWLAEDAAGLIGFLSEKSPSYEVENATEAWAAIDPKAALNFLANIKNPEKAEQFATSVSLGLNEHSDPEVVLSMIGKFGRQTGVYATTTLISLAAKSAPERLAAESAKWSSHLREQVVKALDGSELERDPSAALTRLRGEPGAIKRFMDAITGKHDLTGKLFERVNEWPEGALQQIAGSQPALLVSSDPSKWLTMDLAGLGLDESQARRVRDNALRRVVTTNPKETLPDLLGGTLSPKERQTVISVGFSRLATWDLAMAEGMLTILNDEEEIAAAKKEIEERKIFEARQPTLAPKEWLETLAKEPHGSGLHSPHHWSASEAASARENFRQLPADQKDQAAQTMVQRKLFVHEGLGAEALSFLLENPVEGRKLKEASVVMAAGSLASDWGNRDPGAASQWAQSLPKGNARKSALQSVTRAWAEYEPAEARHWIATLPEEERAKLETYLEQKGVAPR